MLPVDAFGLLTLVCVLLELSPRFTPFISVFRLIYGSPNSSRQTVPRTCAAVKVLQASQTAAIDGGAGSGRERGQGTACKHSFTLLSSEWNNVYFWERESIKETILKLLKTRLKRLRLIHRKDKSTVVQIRCEFIQN